MPSARANATWLPKYLIASSVFMSRSQACLPRLVKHNCLCRAHADPMTTIGERIKEAMDAAGLDPPRLGRAIGVSKQAISAMISGSTKSPTAENVFKIADATGYQARWITTGKGPKTKRDAAQESLDLSEIDPQSRAAFRAALRSYAEQSKNESNSADLDTRKEG